MNFWVYAMPKVASTCVKPHTTSTRKAIKSVYAGSARRRQMQTYTPLIFMTTRVTNL